MPFTPSPGMIPLADLVDAMREWGRDAGGIPPGAAGAYERARLAVEAELARDDDPARNDDPAPPPPSPWVRVEDRLPDVRTWVLGITHFGSCVVAACNSETGDPWSDQQGYTIHITHWMPIPLPPDARP